MQVVNVDTASQERRTQSLGRQIIFSPVQESHELTTGLGTARLVPSAWIYIRFVAIYTFFQVTDPEVKPAVSFTG